MWLHLSGLSGKFAEDAIALGSKPPLATRIARTGLGTRLESTARPNPESKIGFPYVGRTRQNKLSNRKWVHFWLVNFPLSTGMKGKFTDSDKMDSRSLSPERLERFLHSNNVCGGGLISIEPWQGTPTFSDRKYQLAKSFPRFSPLFSLRMSPGKAWNNNNNIII